MDRDLTVTYKGITRVIHPADLTSAAAMLSFYDAKVNQYTVAGLRRLTFHLYAPGVEEMAIRDVRRVAHQLQVGAYAEKTAVIEPPLRADPRPGRVFHRAALTRAPASITTYPPTEEPVTIEPTDINRKKKKKAKATPGKPLPRDVRAEKAAARANPRPSAQPVVP